MYKVVKAFTDLNDNNHVYLAGDEYPRKDVKPSAKRIDELCSKFNKRGEVLIEEVVEKKAEPEAVEKAEVLKKKKDAKPAKKKSAKKEDIKEK